MIDTTVFQDKKAVYYTLGCKLNFSETSSIGKMLKDVGVRTVRKGEKADICVINTCSVTEIADKKCRQAIHRLTKQHPGAFVVVTGCYAQLKPEQVSNIEGVAPEYSFSLKEPRSAAATNFFASSTASRTLSPLASPAVIAAE